MSGNNQQGEPTFILAILLALIAGLGWLFWHMTQGFWISHVFRWLRFAELGILNLFTHKFDACMTWLRYAQPGAASGAIVPVTNACYGADYLAALPPQDRASFYMLTMPPLTVLGAETALYYRWLVIPVLLVIGWYVLFRSPTNKFSTRHTLQTFIETQARMWPVITPIVKFNPSKSGRILGGPVPAEMPMFAEALSPEEWISWAKIPMNAGRIDNDAVRRTFIQQLGPRWTPIDRQPVHIRALFAAFAARGAQKRDESEDLLGQLALAWSPDKGFKPDGKLIQAIDQFIRNPEIGSKAAAIAAQHAWRTTALLGVLKWARANGGVLAPAQFLWLRGTDRPLWYALNNLGRRSFHTEGAGALAHFMAESAAQKPLPIPRVETAIMTINDYLYEASDTNNRKAIPIPPRESKA